MDKKRREIEDRELKWPWRAIYSAIWLVGLAILFWQDWLWPGILVLVALTMVLKAMIAKLVPDAFEAWEEEWEKEEKEGRETSLPLAPEGVAGVPSAAAKHRIELLPSECPKCGAPVRGGEVQWTGAQSADCPYCGANLPMHQG